MTPFSNMSLPPLKRSARKCGSDSQTNLSFAPIDNESCNEILSKPPPPELAISETKHQVIPSTDSYTIRRVKNAKVTQLSKHKTLRLGTTSAKWSPLLRKTYCYFVKAYDEK